MTGNALLLVQYLMQAPREKLFDLTEHRAKRSRSQNAYYWELLDQTAEKMRMSRPEMHNRMLRALKKPKLFGDEQATVFLPDTDEVYEKALQDIELHLYPTKTTTNGKAGPLRMYVILKGSSELDTGEMSQLLDLMIQEAQQQGIQTMTPAELANLRRLESEGRRSTRPVQQEQREGRREHAG